MTHRKEYAHCSALRQSKKVTHVLLQDRRKGRSRATTVAEAENVWLVLLSVSLLIEELHIRSRVLIVLLSFVLFSSFCVSI